MLASAIALVFFDVLHEATALRKIFTAKLTFIWSFAGMHAHMLHQRSRLGKCLVADFTLERPFAGVYAQVSNQMRFVRKQFAANATQMCLHFVQNAQLTGMAFHVRYQIGTLWKTFFTYFTWKWTFTGVRPFVYCKH